MKITSKILAGTVVIALTNTVAQAQSGPPTKPSGPVQYVTNQEFEELLQSGQLQLTNPQIVAEQDQRIAIQERANLETIGGFLRNHHDLRRLSESIALQPTGTNIVRLPGGDYKIQVPDRFGTRQTVETLGQSSKLSMIAGAIRSSTDPTQQLALYRHIYSKYAALFDQVCASGPGIPGTVPGKPPAECSRLPQPAQLPNPSDLGNASLQQVQQALQTIGSQALNIIKTVPIPVRVLTCTSGESVVANNVTFGDQTNSMGCTVPSAGGIFKNFNFVNKNLLSPVKEQGRRGTCHIFAATSSMEEVVARDTGCIVNLSEEDLMEHVKLLWSPAPYVDGGDPGADLALAASNAYDFAWESQWDYNPSWWEYTPPSIFAYDDSCTGYPYPGLEPGCSDTSSQAPIVCTVEAPDGQTVCGFKPAVLSGSRSPYMSDGANGIWNPANQPLSFDMVILALAFNDGVILGFGATNDFESPNPDGYITYSTTDVTNPNDFLGGHAVHLVGYVANSDLAANPATASAPPGAGGGYFIIKNSWGACAGDAGYYYMPVAYLEATVWNVYSVSSETH
ncbi:MAG: hypothetical protein JO061_11060 [Acidobacteriaceae bacterium]|nr:hypothetical protein [Acidobacteriaceae bacterium]